MVANLKSIAYFTKNARRQCKELVSILETSGCHMFESTAQEHDLALSMIQVGVHMLVFLFGKAITNLDISFEILLQYATPPFKQMLFLLYRIISGVPDVYWDIQCNNVFGADMRSQLKKNLNQLITLIDNGNRDEFISLVDNIKQITHLESSLERQQSTFDKINGLLDPYFVIEETNRITT